MSDPDAIWVLADPRPGTAAQALGIAERLGRPFRTVPLEWGPLARLPWPVPTLAGLTAGTRAALRPPWPRLVLSAGRRSAPVALWLGRRGGARTVHCMRPGFGAAAFDLLVLGRHDRPDEAAAPNLLPILGATHRLTPARLAEARAAWAPVFGPLPAPRVALLLGGPAKGRGMDPGLAGRIAGPVSRFAGSVLATTSRRTGDAAAEALAASLPATPHHLHRYGAAGANPYPGLLAWADAVVVTGDSVSMISEALVTAAPLFIAEAEGLRRNHLALHASLYAAGQARPLAEAPAPPPARTPLDETGRVAAAVAARLLA